MLVLSRKSGESLIIGGEIRVKVVGVHGQQVRIGIEAPVSIPIVREELHRQVAAANVQAAKPDESAVAGLADALRLADEPREDEP